jgi:hypothetical protein
LELVLDGPRTTDRSSRTLVLVYHDSTLSEGVTHLRCVGGAAEYEADGSIRKVVLVQAGRPAPSRPERPSSRAVALPAGPARQFFLEAAR